MRLEDAQAFYERGNLAAARKIALQLVKRGQRMAQSLQLLGYIEGREGNFVQAAKHLAASVKYGPEAVQSWYYLGMAHQKLGQHAPAAAALLQAAQLAPSFFEAAHDLGLALHALGRYADALPHFERAAMLRPTSFEAQFNRGINFGKLRRYADELACYEQALRIDGTNEQLLESFGLALIEMREFLRAVGHFQRMLTLYPGHDIARGALLHAKMRISDWEGLAEELPKLHRAIADGRNCIAPHHLIALPSTPAEQLAVAQQFTGQYAADDSAVFTRTERTRSDRVRLAYMSSDFRIHPSAFLMARHYELHDRARFEVTAISIGVQPATKARSAVDWKRPSIDSSMHTRCRTRTLPRRFTT